MNDIIFIIPTIGRDSLKNSIMSIINLNGNYKFKIIVIFDGIENTFHDLKNENIFFIEIEKCGNLDKKNNAGLVRNKGIEFILNNNIKSEFIAFLDDDDTIHPDYIINLYDEKKKFSFDCLIFRMMYPNYKIVPHSLTTKLSLKNVGISFLIKYNLLETEKLRFINHPYEDFIFINNLKLMKKEILISKYVNYFIKTSYNKCSKYIKKYPNIYI